MDSERDDEFEVGKTVDEWIMVEGTDGDFYVGMIGERAITGSSPRFTETPDGSCEVVLVGPPDADGRRRIGIHRAKS